MAYKTIVLKGQGTASEATANAAITPGHLVELMSTGNIRVHASAGQNAQRMFAVEDELQGNGISTAYAANARAFYRVMLPGDEVYALINNGENVSIGDFLESAGNGCLKKHTADSAGAVEYPEGIVGIAKEAVDMSDSSAADPSGRCIVEIV